MSYNYNSKIFSKIKTLLKNFREFYHQKKGVDVSKIKKIEDIPFLKREDFNDISQFLRSGKEYFVTMTSGSTTNSFFILRNKKSFDAHIKRQVKIYKTAGLSKKDRFLNLLSYSISGAARIIDEALGKIGVCRIPVGSIKTRQHLHFVIKVIQDLHPTVIEGYVNEVYEVFSRIGKKHSIKKCIVTGEYLSNDFKEIICKIGGVEIFNNYGSMEFSGFAISDDPKDEYMRLFEDGLYIEILKDDGSVSELGKGKIVITDLENFCMPFIRYILGDIVEIIKRGEKKYIKVLGRTDDSILLDGEVFSKQEIIETIQGILKHPHFFLLINKNPYTYKDKVLINLSPSDKDKIEKIKKAISERLRILDIFEFNIYKGSVPKTSTGKFRHIIDLRKNVR